MINGQYKPRFNALHTFIAQMDNNLYIQDKPPLPVEYMLTILGWNHYSTKKNITNINK